MKRAPGGRAALGDRSAGVRTQVPVSRSGLRPGHPAPRDAPRASQRPPDRHPRRHGLRSLRAALRPGHAELQRVGTEQARTEKLFISKKSTQNRGETLFACFFFFWLNVRHLASRGVVS